MSPVDTPSLAIRPVRGEDIEAVARLAGELGYPAGPEQIRARLAAIAREEDQAVVVAEGPEGVVGWIHVGITLSLESEPWAEIRGLVVSGSRRGQGVGRRLVEFAERWAVERGHSRIRVRTNVLRQESPKFYARLGFVQVKTQAVFFKELAEAKERRPPDNPPGRGSGR